MISAHTLTIALSAKEQMLDDGVILSEESQKRIILLLIPELQMMVQNSMLRAILIWLCSRNFVEVRNLFGEIIACRFNKVDFEDLVEHALSVCSTLAIYNRIVTAKGECIAEFSRLIRATLEQLAIDGLLLSSKERLVSRDHIRIIEQFVLTEKGRKELLVGELGQLINILEEAETIPEVSG